MKTRKFVNIALDKTFQLIERNFNLHTHFKRFINSL